MEVLIIAKKYFTAKKKKELRKSVSHRLTNS